MSSESDDARLDALEASNVSDDARLDALEESAEAAEQSASRAKIIAFLLLINTTIIGLGQLSEAISLINDAYDYVLSQFSNGVEYDLLNSIQVGNTVAYAEDLLGNPQVSRRIADGVTANYFFNKKFLLTLFFQDDRIAAYTILPLRDGFQPEVGADKLPLGTFSYKDYSIDVRNYSIDNSKTASFYLETLEQGRRSLLAHSYLGQLSYGAGENVSSGDHSQEFNQLITKLYKMEVTGSESEIETLHQQLRQTKPNFYGEGSLDQNAIEKSLLTVGEFQRYFPQA